MKKGLERKIPWGVLKIAFLMVMFLTIASGGQTSCEKGDQSCDQGWDLLADDESASGQVLGSSTNLADMNALNVANIAFDFQNQTAAAEMQNVVTGNDTSKIIRLVPNDIDNALLSYRIISPPSHGNLSGTAPNMIYMPEKGYTGNDSIVIGVSDGIGGEKTVSIVIDILELYHPPSVIIRSPRDGDIFTAYPDEPTFAEVPVHVTSSGEVATISLYDGLNLLDTGTCPTGTVGCPVTFIEQLYVGTHTLIAKATDSKDITCASLPVVITVNPPEPIVEITNPYDGQIFTAPVDITIDADITDSNPVNVVEFFANSKKFGQIDNVSPYSFVSKLKRFGRSGNVSPIDNVSPYSFVWTDVKPGVYNLAVKAVDDRGNSAISKSVLIIVVPAKALSKSDLVITMSSSSNPAPAGGLLNYLLTVTNRGPDSATDVTVQDYLPPELVYLSSKATQGEYNAGIWSVGGMTKYRSAKLVITVQTPAEVPPGQIANTAYVFGAELDPDNSNNHATIYTRLTAGNVSPG